MNRSLKMNSVLFNSLGAVGIALAFFAGSAYAATVPLSENFDGGTTSFVTSVQTAGQGTWTDDNTIPNTRFVQSNQGTGQGAASSITLTGLDFATLGLGSSSNNYFLVSGTVQVPTYPTTGANGVDIGINLFGDVAALTNAYRVDFNPSKNQFRIASTDASPTGAFTFDPLETYSLSVKGWYTASDTLNLDFTFSDPSQAPVTISGVDTVATLINNTNFGFRSRTGTGTAANNGTFVYDNFSASVVPEPSAYAMFGSVLLGLGFIGYRRRS